MYLEKQHEYLLWEKNFTYCYRFYNMFKSVMAYAFTMYVIKSYIVLLQKCNVFYYL